jgi:hypothetical protein
MARVRKPAQVSPRSSLRLNVGDAAVVVDGDVDAVPAVPAVGVRAGRSPTCDAMPGTAESAQLLDVEVDQLSGPASLIAVGRLRRLQARQPVQPEALQDRTNRRDRHLELRRDARRGHPQPP